LLDLAPSWPSNGEGAALAESAAADTGLGCPLLRGVLWPRSSTAARTTGYRVQGFVAEEVSDDQTYVSVTCIVCRQTHLVNPSTGKVLGEDEH
jgi:hypothetical protein